MEPLDYLHLQMRLEGKEVINGCLIRQVELVPDEKVPLVLLAELADAKLVGYYDETIFPDLQKDLSLQISDIEFPDIDPLLTILRSRHVRFDVGYYKTYVCAPQFAKDVDVICLSKNDPRVKASNFDGLSENVYAIERNGALVSACVSARENKKCGEAWVYTAPEYRHQGFAHKVVQEWAGSLIDAGKVPFYSHEIANTASANLARKLGLQPVFEEISIAQIHS